MATRPKKNKRNYGVKHSEIQISGYTRIRSASEYHTARWTKESKAFRALNPLCVICKQKGVISASEVVDHIIPLPVCEDFFDQKNWQPLCKKHNVEKGNRDKKLIENFKNKSNE